MAESADAALAFVPTLAGDWLDVLRKFADHQRLLLITDLRKREVRNLRFIPARDVFDLDDSGDVIRQAMLTLARTTPLQVALHARGFDTDPEIAVIVNTLLHADPPITSVKRLALVIGKDRRTVWNRLSDRGGAKSLIDSMLLLRVAHLMDGRRSWKSVSTRLGISTDRLRRMARKAGYGHPRAFLDKDTADGSEAAIATRIAAQLASVRADGQPEPCCRGRTQYTASPASK